MNNLINFYFKQNIFEVLELKKIADDLFDTSKPWSQPWKVAVRHILVLTVYLEIWREQNSN